MRLLIAGAFLGILFCIAAAQSCNQLEHTCESGQCLPEHSVNGWTCDSWFIWGICGYPWVVQDNGIGNGITLGDNTGLDNVLWQWDGTRIVSMSGNVLDGSRDTVIANIGPPRSANPAQSWTRSSSYVSNKGGESSNKVLDATTAASGSQVMLNPRSDGKETQMWYFSKPEGGGFIGQHDCGSSATPPPLLPQPVYPNPNPCPGGGGGSGGGGGEDCHPAPVTSECKPSEHKCGDKTCIAKSKVCDGKKDCKDGSDEPKKKCGKGKKKKKKKCEDCVSLIIHRGWFFEYVHYKESTTLPGPQNYPHHCYHQTCVVEKKYCYWEVHEENKCAVCTEAGVEYPLGTVRKCKNQLPAPCYCDVCMYANQGTNSTKPFPPGNPQFQKMGLACDCPHKAAVNPVAPVKPTVKPTAKPPVSGTVDPSVKSCGITTRQDTRIVGGTAVTALGIYPWQARLFFSFEGDDGEVLCGGTIISDTWIMTAAHCVRDDKTNKKLIKVAVQLGSLQQEDDPSAEVKQSMSPPEVKQHESYDKDGLKNDIALVKLASTVTWTKNVRPACLPCSSATIDLKDKTLSLAGWGLTANGGSTSPVLLSVQIPVVTKEACQTTWPTVNDNQLCLGGKNSGKNSCEGDSGGGAIYKKGNVNYVVGIVSFGPEAGCGIEYQVYTRVTSFISWIEANSGKKHC